MDIWVIWVLLLDVVQATGVWFQDGRVMEHLVERDAQEDHIELRDRQRYTEAEIKEKQNRGGENGRDDEVGMFPVSVPFILNQSTL